MPSTSNCHDPELAVNPAGAAVAVADCGSDATAMSAAFRPAGGPWASAAAIPGSGPGVDPRVGIDDSGNAMAVWENDTTNTIQSSRRPAAGPWAAALPVSPGTQVALDPDVAMSPTGRATATWRHDLSPSDPVVTVETASQGPGSGAWGGAQVLTPPATSTHPVTVDEPQVAWNRTSGRLAVWANVTTPALPVLQSEFGGAGGWGGDILVQTASDGVRTVEQPQVALDDQGRAVAVWRSYDSGPGQFGTQASTTNYLNDNWSPPDTLSTTAMGLSAVPSVAIDPAGDSTIVWRDLSGTVFAVSRPPGGAFGTPVSIATTSFGNPRVTMDAAGNALATWDDQASSPQRVVVAVNDVTPPELSLAGPSTAEPGSPITLTASATDAWSPPVAITWDLGDGSTGAGDSVSHAYAVEGTMTATATATDAASNTASRSMQIEVTRTRPPLPRAVALDVSVPKQSWRKIRRAHGVKLLCTLDAVGDCDATASVSGRVAKRLGLGAGREARNLSIGGGRVLISQPDHAATLKVKLTADARAAIAAATKKVPLKLSVNGSATDREPATVQRKFVIRR